MNEPVQVNANVGAETQTLVVELPVNSTFHLWLKAISADLHGSVSFSSARGKFGEVLVTNAEEHEFRIFHVFGGGRIELSYDPAVTRVSVIYWFALANVLETGITVVHTHEVNAPPDLPFGYHFRPPFGWMNDPNGFGRFAGRPHLFYQHYSHGLRWNTMHWGHAVSSDYLRWRHLPIFLFPSQDLSARPDKRGGAFSGSAIPLTDGPGIRVFFTEQVQGRQPEEQVQLTATSQDIIMAGQADVILANRPENQGLTSDFRDPYVFRGPDGLWKMLLGSQSDDGGVVLLYETQDHTAASNWTYVGKLLVETRYRTTAIECPCLLPLDGLPTSPATRWVVIFGLMNSTDSATGRKNLTLAVVGWFDGRSFSKEFEQELDFAADNYAFQAFVDGGSLVGISWLANWADASPSIDFPTAMTLPRNIILSEGALCTPPIGPVESLRGPILDRTRLAAGEKIALGRGAAEIAFELAEPGLHFDLQLGHADIEIGVLADASGLSVYYHPTNQPRSSVRYLARNARAKGLRIFLDYGSIEVFADNGRWTGTKRIAGFDPIVSARLISDPGVVSQATVWSLSL